ncbi:hypothetical protein Pla100_25060 [Neorhodopirellula pilleata]|uniref:Uncharacterized protein n=1 Tax=Neorhodopirellula pilleata TaxID=2714738 RepID=A0A5C6ABG3_9BACT|nr:hypothetical protein Pla100_25060 [Neorhodopirellula pilleata]
MGICQLLKSDSSRWQGSPENVRFAVQSALEGSNRAVVKREKIIFAFFLTIAGRAGEGYRIHR